MQPMLFATMAAPSVSIVLMRLGSFTFFCMYSTFGSHRGQFQIIVQKNQDPPQARPPPS